VCLECRSALKSSRNASSNTKRSSDDVVVDVVPCTLHVFGQFLVNISANFNPMVAIETVEGVDAATEVAVTWNRVESSRNRSIWG